MASANGIAFKPDGTRMYVLDTGLGGELAELSLSTPWDSSTATLSGVSGDTLRGQGIAIRDDGRAFWALGTTTPSTVRMHIMTTPWTASTAVFGNFMSIGSQESTPTGLAFKSDGTKMYIVGSTTDTVYQYSLSTAWSVSTAVYDNVSFSINAQEGVPTGITFSTDGTNMYIIGSAGDDVNQYSLSTAWDISTASYVRVRTAGDSVPQDVAFSTDGTNMYIVADTGASIIQYPLSTAWDVSTAGTSSTFYVSAQDGTPTGIAFKPDGSRMYVLGDDGNDVNEYSLSTPWSVSSATYVRAFVVDDTAPQAIAFNDTGTRMFILGDFNNRVYEYDLSIGWDLSTASYAVLALPSANDLFIKPDGTKLYVASASTDLVYEYDVSTPWDLYTATLRTSTSVLSSVGTSVSGITFSSDGLAMYLTDSSVRVSRFDLLTAWDLDTAVFSHFMYPGVNTESIAFDPTDTRFYIATGASGGVAQFVGTVPKAIRSPGNDGKQLSVAVEDATPTGIEFKPDGTAMYMSGATGDEVNQYSLSVPWDITTATYVQVLAVGTEDTLPADLTFKPDGTRMFIVGSTNDRVYQYNLSTPWDISTATYIQFFAIGGQESTPTGLAFKPDGTRMYVIGSAGDDINEYSLSTAWDISTASFVRVSASLAAQESVPQALVFRPDGSRVYTIGTNSDAINEYDLTTPWDVSSIVFRQSLIIGYLNAATPNGLAFKYDGTKLYIADANADTIFELNLG
jgi:DNA-binding beta-propeller fold protein YncE